MGGPAFTGQLVRKRPLGILPRAYYDRVRLDVRATLTRFAKADAQPVRGDAFVVHSTDHPHTFHVERGAMDPSSRLSKTPSKRRALTLQKGHGARWNMRPWTIRRETAPGQRRIADTPFRLP